MRILIAHNYYQQSGGEDTVVEQEFRLLRDHGHSVELFQVSNDDIKGIPAKISVALNTHYSNSSRATMSREIAQFQPDIVHVHNFFPLLTPSIYDACLDAGVPVIQTLHNYRTICAGGLLLRNGRICEDCIGGSPYQGAWHGCYRDSRLGSLAVARMISYHHNHHTWRDKVDRFIVLTEFAKNKFIEAGFPAEKISVKANFNSGEHNDTTDHLTLHPSPLTPHALFVGRLSPEKGIDTLLKAWQSLAIPLFIAGDGPLQAAVTHSDNTQITSLGQLNPQQVYQHMSQAAFLVMPSEWYEGFPMVLVEAFAHGLPVIAAKIGSLEEIVDDGVTGLHFEPGNADDLAMKVQWLVEHPEDCQRMGENARQIYLKRYTPDINYHLLMDIYQRVIADDG